VAREMAAWMNKSCAALAAAAVALLLLLAAEEAKAAGLPAVLPTSTAEAAAEVRRPDDDLIALFVRRGEELLSAGDLSGARILLQHAAKAGNAHAALLLGATYDPTLLNPFAAGNGATDVALARAWYAIARELGSPDARRRIEALARREPWSDLPSRP
jgi:TPR repeat protein